LNLLDDVEPAPAVDDALDVVVLMAGREHERRTVGAHVLVLVQRRLEATRAVRVGALADELRARGVEALRALRNALVHVSEQRRSAPA